MVNHFLSADPLQIIVQFWKVGNMPTVFASCTHLLARPQEKTFEDVFLVKIENKGSALT